MKKLKTEFAKARVVMIAIVSCCLLSSCKSVDYKRGQDLMTNGKYQEAFAILSTLDYSDSVEKTEECRYNIALEAFNNRDWETVILWCDGLAYEDSEELLASAQKEKGMTEKADYAFLNDIAESITKRLETSNSGNVSSTQLVNVDLTYVEKYYNLDFYDNRLGELAKQYIDGVRQEKNALKQEHEFEKQIEWAKGRAKRFSALRELYNEYSLLKDDASFVGNYVADADYMIMLVDAYDAIEKDIESQQIDGDLPWYVDGDAILCSLQNNTKYTFSTIFYFYIYNESDQLIDKRSAYIERITPNSSYRVEMYFGDLLYSNYSLSFEWENYYIEESIR